MRQYRGVPPQRGGIQRGAPPPQPGGGRGFMGMMNRARQQYAGGQNVPGMNRYLEMRRGPGQSTRMNIPPGGTPQGALAQMYGRAQQQQAGAQPGGILARIRQAQQQQQQAGGQGGILARIRQAMQQRQQQAGGLPPGVDPRAVAANPEGYARQQAEWARQGVEPGFRPGAGPGAGQGILPGEMRGPMGPMNIVDPTTGESTPYYGPGGREGYEERRRQFGDTVYDRNWPPRGPMAPGGGPLQPRSEPWRPGTGFPGGPPIPGMPPRGGGFPIDAGGVPWKRPPGGRPAPPPGKGPGGSGPFIPGGPQVPPNLRGYLQRQRMMNRPPANVGGAQAQRVGMQDQQGALSRAMQRGTGRAPMSRRMGFGRGAQQ